MEERARGEKLEAFLGRRGKTLLEAIPLAMRILTYLSKGTEISTRYSEGPGGTHPKQNSKWEALCS